SRTKGVPSFSRCATQILATSCEFDIPGTPKILYRPFNKKAPGLVAWGFLRSFGNGLFVMSMRRRDLPGTVLTWYGTQGDFLEGGDGAFEFKAIDRRRATLTRRFH
ncbi:MAG: hypothetical protein ACI97A_003333, partial [Planctomycetota bacterium]